VTSSLQDLLAVQDLDLTLDQLRHRRSHLPERAELSDLDAATRTRQQELAALRQVREELAARQAHAEAELAATEERSRIINKRMYGGEVSASRDLQAMAAELEQLKVRSSGLEDAVLAVLEELEPLDGRATELEQELAGLAGDRTAVTARLAAAEEAIDRETAEVVGRRAAAASAVAESLLATYERLRARLGGVGVARLVGNHCDGCHLTLSAMELDRVRHLPDGEVYTCEQCSRILVP
jgi:hypothetical protein